MAAGAPSATRVGELPRNPPVADLPAPANPGGISREPPDAMQVGIRMDGGAV